MMNTMKIHVYVYIYIYNDIHMYLLDIFGWISLPLGTGCHGVMQTVPSPPSQDSHHQPQQACHHQIDIPAASGSFHQLMADPPLVQIMVLGYNDDMIHNIIIIMVIARRIISLVDGPQTLGQWPVQMSFDQCCQHGEILGPGTFSPCNLGNLHHRPQEARKIMDF